MITDLTEQFDSLMQSLRDLRSLLLRHQPQHWLALTDAEKSTAAGSLNILCDLLTDVWYRDGQDGRETRSRHGLVMINDQISEQIKLCNERKDAFRAIVQKTQKALETSQFNEHLGALGTRHSALRESLHFSGLSRVHLKQCYRHIPVLEAAPLKVGFSWYTNGRSIRRLSVDEAEQKLLALGEDKAHIQIQLNKLHGLPATQGIAQVQTLAPVVRANLVYPDSHSRQRQAMNVALPLMIPGELLPEFNQIASEPPAERTRQRRSDQKVSDDPFLPSIRVHLYHAAD